MVVGRISQQLYVRALPPGVSMFITDVQFSVPSTGSWAPGLQGIPGGHGVYPTTTTAQKQAIFPVAVDPTKNNGFIGTASLTSTSVLDHGIGPEIYINFNLTGEAIISQQPPLNVQDTAFITVSSDEWGRTARPNYSVVSYYLPGVPAKSLLNSLPVLQSPKDVSFVVAASPQEKKVGINASVDSNAIKDLIGYALQGIFAAHEKAVGWVIGAV